MKTLPPQDLFTENGVNFADEHAVTAWCTALTEKLADYKQVFFHVAPPCASFSRARDRSIKTRLRSSAVPGGWYHDDPTTINGNKIAVNTARVVDFLLDHFEAVGSWEQPAGSYMFPYLESITGLQHQPSASVLLHQCRFGRSYRKPTIFYCFGGLRLQSLNRQCTSASSCGRSFHQTLGFGRAPTAAAAAYPPALARAYAADLASHLRLAKHRQVLDQASLHVDGTVHRHISRGPTDRSRRALREAEDAVSRAGALSHSTLSQGF